ncbi:hypothetical protein ACHAWF_010465 [Thalassiosira exigua]
MAATPASAPRTAAASLLLLLLAAPGLLLLGPSPSHVAADEGADRSAGGGGGSGGGGGGGVPEFAPPKLSFVAPVVGGIELDASAAAPWTIFQSVGSPLAAASTDSASSSSERTRRDKAAAERRSGPLLTLFPEGGEDDDSSSLLLGLGGSSPPSSSSSASPGRRAKHSVLAPPEQRSYLQLHEPTCRAGANDASSEAGGSSTIKKGALLDRYDAFARSPALSDFAAELWKYCALYVEGGVYVDADSAPLAATGDALGWDPSGDGGGANNANYVAVADGRDAGVSPSLLSSGGSVADPVPRASSAGTGRRAATSSLIAVSTKEHRVMAEMIATLIETPPKRLEEEALLLPRALMRAIEEDVARRGGKWGFLRQRCSGVEVAGGGGSEGGGRRTLRRCPPSSGYCCEVLGPDEDFVYLLSRRPLVPEQVLPDASTLPRPYGLVVDPSSSSSEKAVDGLDDDLPFLSIVRDVPSSPLLPKRFEPGSSETTPNAFETLSAMGALPNQESDRKGCMDCLREKKAADCGTCGKQCPKFCGGVCEVEVKEKPVKRVLEVGGPRYRKDPERWIPRIVHQTWFEPVTPEKYPNMARLIESWKLSGWEYHFWDDASAAEFLSLHFPPEVREAYDSILPGAFKADLFRYCVLLIKGGVYADMDVMLESNLDAAVPPDVGFMVPVDAPGSKPDHRMCLWNGMIAAAPAHPYLSRVIEHVVNNIRNRFTVRPPPLEFLSNGLAFCLLTPSLAVALDVAGRGLRSHDVPGPGALRRPRLQHALHGGAVHPGAVGQRGDGTGAAADLRGGRFGSSLGRRGGDHPGEDDHPEAEQMGHGSSSFHLGGEQLGCGRHRYARLRRQERSRGRRRRTGQSLQ